MILITNEARRGLSCSVECSEHGFLGRQTAVDYCLDRVSAHRDETGCDGPLGGVNHVTSGPQMGRWSSWCDGCGVVAARSTKALGLALIKRHLSIEPAIAQ